MYLSDVYVGLGPGDQNKVFTEEDWSNTDNLEPYAKSKTLAEKAAWEYINELPGN